MGKVSILLTLSRSNLLDGKIFLLSLGVDSTIGPKITSLEQGPGGDPCPTDVPEVTSPRHLYHSPRRVVPFSRLFCEP